ncbi:MAG: hypothetical protein Q7S03_04100 [bacterium]|nr:hypothetical protein [bacterium]
MKTRIQAGYFAGKVSVDVYNGGDVVIEGRHDYTVKLEEMECPWCESLSVCSVNSLSLNVDRKDGWIVEIKTEIGDERMMVVVRHRRDKYENLVDWQYLTKYMEWCQRPSGYSRLPEDTLRMPIFVLDKVQAEQVAALA